MAEPRVDHAVATWGTHDWVGQHQLEHGLSAAVPGARVLLDDSCVIDGVRFWGNPWSLALLSWAFMAGEEELASKYHSVPVDTDVVISHGPPFGCGDLTVDGTRAGSQSLREHLLKLSPRLAVFGHIHEAAGRWEIHGGLWVNASVLNSHYQVVRKPVLIELDPRPIAVNP